MKLLFELLLIALIFLVLIGLVIFLIYRIIKKKYVKHIEKKERLKKASIPKKELSPEDKRKLSTPIEYELSRNVNSNQPFIDKQYHLNLVGTIHKCTTNRFVCRYDFKLHVSRKSDLYYEMIRSNFLQNKVDQTLLEQMISKRNLRNLYPFSSTIEKSSNPLEVIVATLGQALLTVTEDIMRKETYSYSKRADFEETVAKLIGEIYHYHGMVEISKLDDKIPKEILKKGYEVFICEYNGERKHYRYLSIEKQIENSDRLLSDAPTFKDLDRMHLKKLLHQLTYYYPKFALYMNDKNWGTEDNREYYAQYGWYVYAFEHFSELLNTSKILNQPIIDNSIDESTEIIKVMDNTKLLATLDDLCSIETDLDELMKNANYFNYTDRNDVSVAANETLKAWYKSMRDRYLTVTQIPASHITTLKNIVLNEAKKRQIQNV